MEEEEKNDYLGWIIEWKTLSSTSRQRGIVIDWNKKRNKLIVIEDTNPSTGNMIEIPIKRTQIIKIKPGDVTDIQIKLNIEKKIQKIEKSDQDAYEILSQILHGLEKKGIDPHKALYSAIEKKSESTEKVSEDKRMPSVVEIPISEDESGSEDNSESDDDGSEDSEEEGDEDDDNDDDEENDEEEEDSGEAEEVEDEEDEDEDEDEDDEEDEDEDDEDDESENEIEDEEEDEEEDEKSEEEVDEESENDSSSDDEDEDEDRIDVKVYIHLPADMTANHVPLMSTTQTNSIIIRAFNINKYKMISKITHLLTSDYQRKPVLYYRDREGDEITLSNNSDMKNILKLHEKEHNKKKSYERKLKLIAKFPPSSPTKLLLPEEKEFRTQQTRQVESVWSQSTNLWGRRWENTQTQFDNRDTNTASIESFQNGEFVWQKGDLIGSGSFGQVYSAIHLTTGNKMAVKEVYLSGTKGHREQAEALKTEIKVLSALDHPHIIKYYGAECTKDTLRIFLELASDGSVKDILNSFGSLAEPVLRRYTHDMLSGLLFLHSKGYIHRDIKPSNLLLDHNVVKLADFGCTTSVRLDQGESSNGHNTIIGTTIYMSPEVMRGNEADDESTPIGYGRKADIWSVGITVVEMATGKLPFRNAAAAIYTICVSKEYPTLPDEFSIEAHHFLSRCLVENPKDRASCEEIYTHAFCRPMTSAPFHNQRTTTSTLLLQPDIDITDISPRDSPMHGSFEGLDSTEGSSSLFLTANRKKLDWNQINEEDKSSNTTNTHHRHHQKVQSSEFHENYDEMEDVTIKKERK